MMMSLLDHLDAEIIQFFSDTEAPSNHMIIARPIKCHQLYQIHTCTQKNPDFLPPPVLRTRSRRSGVLGVGLRACRGERVFGVEAGEFGSGGRSGGG